MELSGKNNMHAQAKKRIKRIKGFYNHLQIFVIIMLPILLFINTIIRFFESYMKKGDSLEWVKENIWLNAGLWLIAILIHGWVVFKFKVNFIDLWEKNKIDELMNKKE
jgi:4-amino-4-deoxy-L-arabinose transferase-like glycosyltransferase